MMTEHSSAAMKAAPESLDTQSLSPAAFANWGLQEIAYVRPRWHEGAQIYTVHAANGEPMASAPSRDLAYAFVVQNDLTPVDAN